MSENSPGVTIRLNLPRVAVVIINWNCWRDTEPCLKSLRGLDYPDYRVVVVDNASQDGSPDLIARNFPEVKLIRNTENLGTAGGNNTGMRWALENGYDYIWLFNNDADCPPDTLSLLVEEMEKDAALGLAAPVLYDHHDHSHLQNCGSRYDFADYRLRHIESLELLKTVPSDELWLWGTALLIKSALIREIGFYEENLFVYNDDMEFCWRAIRAGYHARIIERASVFHKSHYSGTERKLPLHYYFYTVRNDYFFWSRALPFMQRLRFRRVYLGRTMNTIGDLAAEGQREAAEVCCDALHSAVTGQWGPWDKSRHMPLFLRRHLVRRAYFWTDFLSGNWGKILKRRGRRA